MARRYCSSTHSAGGSRAMFDRGRIINWNKVRRSFGLNAMPARQYPRSTAVVVFAGAAVGIIALHVATNGTLGFHTDELYYLACGRHPALGYVDPSRTPGDPTSEQPYAAHVPTHH